MIAEAAIVSKTGIDSFLNMSIEMLMDMRKAISNVLGSMSNHG